MTAPHAWSRAGSDGRSGADATPRSVPVPSSVGSRSPPSTRPDAVPHAPADRERRAERRLVDEAEGRTGPSQLDPTGHCGAEQVGVAPELVPADLREARGERVVAVVLPLTEDRLERRLPAGESAAHRLGEQLELGLDREPHAPTSASTASVSAPSDGAGRVAAGSSPSNRNTPPSIVIGPSPGCSTSWSRPFARACSSACTDSRARTGPAGTAAEPSRASHASTGSAAIARSIAAVDALLRGEHGRIVGHEIRRRDRRVLETEQPEERLAAAQG